MAKKIEWQKPSTDAVIAIAGGSILDTYVVGNIQFIVDLLAKLPSDIIGISVKSLILGAVALVGAKHFMK